MARNKSCYSSLSRHRHRAKSRELLHPELWLLVPRFCAKVNNHTLTPAKFITFVKELRGQHQGPRLATTLCQPHAGPVTRGSPEKTVRTRQISNESAADTFKRLGLRELCSPSSHSRHFAIELETTNDAGKHRHFNCKYLSHAFD